MLKNFISILKTWIRNRIPDIWFVKRLFRIRMGYPLNLRNPRTFNEKLQWLKLYDRRPLYSTLVDKYAVKKWVADKIGEKYVIPILGVWNKFDDIDFNALPNQFVLKCTHDSGGLVICKEKTTFDIKAAEKKITNCLKKNFFWIAREWPYKNVPHRIIAEKYMEDEKTKQLRDYKFFCFNGKVRCYKIDFDRFTSHKANYYDENSLLIRIGEEVCPPDSNATLEQPVNIHKMISLAQQLSVSLPFVRVDFYEVNGKIYFGEMTLYPGAGFGKFIYTNNDEQLGDWLNLPR